MSDSASTSFSSLLKEIKIQPQCITLSVASTISLPVHLGPLAGHEWHQYTNAIGQVFYVSTTTQEKTYSIPIGFEDQPTDTWARDKSKSWPQWNNQRMGRALLLDPDPPPPQTYLDLPVIRASFNMLVAASKPGDREFRRPFSGILDWIFPVAESYQVVQRDRLEDDIPDFTVLQWLQPPMGARRKFVFMVVERGVGKPWEERYSQLVRHFETNSNDSKNVYGMIHIGMAVQCYKYELGQVHGLSGRLHLMHQAKEVTDSLLWIKGHPLPYVT